jgi:hypothetical protein
MTTHEAHALTPAIWGIAFGRELCRPCADRGQIVWRVPAARVLIPRIAVPDAAAEALAESIAADPVVELAPVHPLPSRHRQALAIMGRYDLRTRGQKLAAAREIALTLGYSEGAAINLVGELCKVPA